MAYGIVKQGRSLLVQIAGELDGRSVDRLLTSTAVWETDASEIVLDMSRVTFVKPAGVCQIACLAAWFSSMSPKNPPFTLVASD